MSDNVERIINSYYTLYSKSLGLKRVQEPKGSDNDFKGYFRDSNSRGIQTKISIDLEFFGNGADYIETIYNVYGVSEKVILTKHKRNLLSLSESFEIEYIQKLDFNTYDRTEKNKGVKIKCIQGGLYDIIKNKEDEDYDLINNLSSDNTDIGELKTVQFQPKGRDIFIESFLESGHIPEYRLNSQRFSRLSSEIGKTVRTVPMTVVYNSDEEDVSNPSFSQDIYNEDVHSLAYDIGSDQDSRNLFFYEAEHDKIIYLRLELDFRITEIRSRVSTPTYFSVSLFNTEKNEQEQDELKSKVSIFQTSSPQSIVGINQSIDTINMAQIVYVDVKKRGSLGIVFTSEMSYQGGITAPRGETDFFIEINKCKLTVRDYTNYTQYASISRAIKPYDFFDRIIAKITGKTGLLKSSIFETGGEYENILIDNGLWARGFPNTYQDSSDNPTSIQMPISYKNAYKSFNYLEPLTWFIENMGNREYVRIEKATYTMQNFIGLDLGSVDEIKTQSSKPDYISRIEIGQERDLDYDETEGIEEYNGKSIFGTFIENDSEYKVLTKIRTDAIGYELTRRVDFTNNPKKSTKRDNHLWMHDTKNVNGIYTHRLWMDIFDSEPKGVYEPESAWNLFLSPMNRLFYGHSYSVKRGLYHFPEKYITFSSSNSNQNLVTVKDGIELKESGSIKISDIDNHRVKATKKTLSFKMTQEIQNQLDGFTSVEGINVPNYYGLVRFLQNNTPIYGRIIKINNKEKGSLEIIKANI